MKPNAAHSGKSGETFIYIFRVQEKPMMMVMEGMEVRRIFTSGIKIKIIF